MDDVSVIATEIISPKLVIPMHYGMFEKDINPNILIDKLKIKGYEGIVKIMQFIESYIYHF